MKLAEMNLPRYGKNARLVNARAKARQRLVGKLQAHSGG